MATGRNPRKEEMSLVEVTSILFLIAMLGGVVLPSQWQLEHTQEEQRNARTCWGNLDQLRQAIDAYGARHNGTYPDTLADLKLSSYPQCPESKDPYRYQVNNLGGSSGRYTVRCAGTHHAEAGLPHNQPYYDSLYGMTPQVIEFHSK